NNLFRAPHICGGGKPARQRLGAQLPRSPSSRLSPRRSAASCGGAGDPLQRVPCGSHEQALGSVEGHGSWNMYPDLGVADRKTAILLGRAREGEKHAHFFVAEAIANFGFARVVV